MIDSMDLDRRRTGGLLLVFGLGVGFTGVHAAHGLSEGEDFSTALFGIVIPAALAITLVCCGYWLARSEFDPDGVARVGVWCLLGALAMSGAGVLIVLYQRAEGVAVSDGTFVVANASTFGSVVGFVVGVYDSRQRATGEQLLVERDRVEQLNQRLTVLNRVLRHDIRTHVNVIGGHAALLRDGVGNDDRRLDIVERRTADIARLSDDARRVERLLDGVGTDTAPVDVVDVVQRQVERLRRDDRDVEIVLDCPDHVYVSANDLLDAALRNVLDGVIDRDATDRESIDDVATIDATTGGDDDPVRIRVSTVRVPADGEAYTVITIECDDARTPDLTFDELTRNSVETPLDHADGLGLWLARWIVEESGGQVASERADDGTTAVTIRLRRASAPGHGASRRDGTTDPVSSPLDERIADTH